MRHVIGRIRLQAFALLAITVAGAAAGRVGAMEPRALAPFQVQAPDGSPVGSGQVAIAGRQVLIYLDANCESCALVFTALDGLDPDEVGALTVIVRGDQASASSLMAKAPPSLAGVRWFTDGAGSAYTAMKLQSSPTVLGLWSGRIHWARTGPLNDAGNLQSAVRSWLGPSAPARQPQ